MPKWTIRVKLLAGLSMVVGMMLTLMGGAVFSLSAFHDSNLMLTDLLRELGASKELIRHVARLEAPPHRPPRRARGIAHRRPRARRGVDRLLKRTQADRHPPQPGRRRHE